jgi:hypothetical protein
MKQILILLVTTALSACTAFDQMGTSLGDLGFPDFGDGTSRSSLTRNGNCPSVARVAELSSMYQFPLPSRPDVNDKISEVHIAHVDATCKKQNNVLKLDLSIDFSGALGPKGRVRAGDKPSFAYPYFVAVTNADNQILAKDIYAAPFGYGADDTQLMISERITQMVPITGGNPGTYRVLVGFQLSSEEVAYNRTLPDDQLGKNLSVITVVPGQP